MKFLFGRRKLEERATRLYFIAVAQARRPEFYLDYQVPDTVWGRFEMIALHVFLILHRLKGGGSEATELAQGVFDTMFSDMDQNLRELGIGDLSVGKKVKELAESFYGRVAAYDQGLSSGTLEDALARNVFALRSGAENGVAAAKLADYVQRTADALNRIDLFAIVEGKADFPEPPEPQLEPRPEPRGGESESAGGAARAAESR